MASDDDGPADADTDDPAAHQEWKNHGNTRMHKLAQVMSKFTQMFENLVRIAEEQQADDRTWQEEERRARAEESQQYEDDRKVQEQQRLLEQKAIEQAQAQERQDWAEERRQCDARFERVLQEHKEQQNEMFKLIVTFLSVNQTNPMSGISVTHPVHRYSPQCSQPHPPVVPPTKPVTSSHASHPLASSVATPSGSMSLLPPMHPPTKPVKASRVSPSISVPAGTTAGIMPPVSMNPSQPKPVPHLLSHTKNFGYFSLYCNCHPQKVKNTLRFQVCSHWLSQCPVTVSTVFNLHFSQIILVRFLQPCRCTLCPV